MNAIDLNFIKALKVKFKEKSHAQYLCHCCPTFKSLWQTNEAFYEEFIELAREFLSVNEYTFKVGSGRGWGFSIELAACLFYSMSPQSDHLDRQIRLDFLDWLIKKLEG